jgi:hypothetical protein
MMELDLGRGCRWLQICRSSGPWVAGVSLSAKVDALGNAVVSPVAKGGIGIKLAKGRGNFLEVQIHSGEGSYEDK